MATAIEVVRKSAISWVLIPDGVAANDVQEAWWRGTRIGDLITFKSTNGAVEFKDINYQFISYLDEVTPGNSVPVFASGYECYNYLKEQGFFDIGSEGGGSGTTFISLDDTPGSYLAAANYLVTVNPTATGLQFLNKVIASKLSELTDGPGAYMNGKYMRSTATGWVWSDGFNVEQNNILKRISLSTRPSSDEPVTITEAVTRMNSRTTVISEIETPVIVYITQTSTTGVSKLYPWFFAPGKGTWGVGGTTVSTGMLFAFTPVNLTPEDIEEDPNASIVNLDPVVDGDFVSKANETFWDFSDSDYENGGKSYYFSYTVDGVLYYALFIGDPGTYGDGATPFVEADFVTTTNDDVDPEINETSPFQFRKKGWQGSVFNTGAPGEKGDVYGGTILESGTMRTYPFTRYKGTGDPLDITNHEWNRSELLTLSDE